MNRSIGAPTPQPVSGEAAKVGESSERDRAKSDQIEQLRKLLANAEKLASDRYEMIASIYRDREKIAAESDALRARVAELEVNQGKE